jgi:hypothetical protein
VLRYGYIPFAVAILYLLGTFGWRYAGRDSVSRTRPYRPVPGIDDATGVKILHFYALPGAFTEGAKSLICYGVVNAKALRIEPPLSGVSPSLNRCLDIAPEQDTRYTLTAEGDDGRVVSESFVVQVKPDPSLLPRIRTFAAGRKQVDRGRTIVSLCFLADNVTEVSIDPPVVSTIHGPRGCFYVSPERSTTYTATAVDARGRTAHKRVTVQIP